MVAAICLLKNRDMKFSDKNRTDATSGHSSRAHSESTIDTVGADGGASGECILASSLVVDGMERTDIRISTTSIPISV